MAYKQERSGSKRDDLVHTAYIFEDQSISISIDECSSVLVLPCIHDMVTLFLSGQRVRKGELVVSTYQDCYYLALKNLERFEDMDLRPIDRNLSNAIGCLVKGEDHPYICSLEDMPHALFHIHLTCTMETRQLLHTLSPEEWNNMKTYIWRSNEKKRSYTEMEENVDFPEKKRARGALDLE